MSEGMQPSVTLSTNTTSHSRPFAEWIVDSTRYSSRCGGPASALVAWGGVQGQLGQKAAACRIGPGNLLQLIEIGRARTNIVMQTFEMWQIALTNQRDLPRPGRRFVAQLRLFPAQQQNSGHHADTVVDR
jgi:hypothetical protein